MVNLLFAAAATASCLITSTSALEHTVPEQYTRPVVNVPTPEECALLNDDFFRFNLSNLYESNAIQAYSWWVDENGPSESHGDTPSHGVMDLFYQNSLELGWNLTCYDIDQRKKHDGRIEARLQYFVAMMHKYTFDYLNTIIDAAEHVRDEIIDPERGVLQLLKSFTPRKDAHPLSTCEAENAIKISLTSDFIYEYDFVAPTTVIDSGVVKFEPSLNLTTPKNIRRGKNPSQEELTTDEDFANGDCDSSRGSFVADNEGRKLAIVTRMTKTFNAVIEEMKGFRETMFRGIPLKGYGSLATSMEHFYFVDYLNPDTMKPRESEAIEGAMKQRTLEAILTALMSNDHCFAKCVYASDMTETLKRGNEKFMSKYRFIPESNKVCQWECLSYGHKPREVGLYAIDRFKDYPALEIGEMSMASYHAWKNDDHPAQYTGRDRLSPGVAYHTYRSQFKMPTCDSQFNVINDLEDTDLGFHNTLMPVCCGNGWRCNETKAFMKALHMEDVHNEDFKEFYTRQMPAALAQQVIRPYTHFNALCQLNMHYPNKDRRHGTEIQPDSHWACEKLAIETRDMDEDHANIHFCKVSEVGKEVRERTAEIDSKRWTNAAWPSYQHMCDDKRRMPNEKCLRSDEENFIRRSNRREEDVVWKTWGKNVWLERDDVCETQNAGGMAEELKKQAESVVNKTEAIVNKTKDGLKGFVDRFHIFGL